MEAFRAQAHVKLIAAGDCVGAHDDAIRCARGAGPWRVGAVEKSVAASLDLADAFLRAGAYAQALPHALAAEHIAAVARVAGARAAAAAAAECLLGLDAGAGGAFAAAAAEALDAHAVGLLGEGLAVRARARLAAGKAARAMRERRAVTDEARGVRVPPPPRRMPRRTRRWRRWRRRRRRRRRREASRWRRRRTTCARCGSTS